MESQKLGEFLILTGRSGKTYSFRVYRLSHDFSKYKKHQSFPALYLVTIEKINESGLIVHNILYWNKTIDLSKLTFNPQLKMSFLEKGASHICILRNKKPAVIEKIQLDLRAILK
ncbi:MAG: hypothetical protein H6569_05960 [Lewinellaceae bacterium]|nr:hypothetical protein [Lewinellaceae bacterium]